MAPLVVRCHLNFEKKRNIKYHFLSVPFSYYDISCYKILYNLVLLITIILTLVFDKTDIRSAFGPLPIEP